MASSLGAAFCVALFSLGHCFRDGWPATGHTHLARLGGAILCGLGACFSGGWEYGLIVGSAIWAGFYFDMKHGDGQGADNLKSFLFLALSGLTSLVPLAIALGFYSTPIYFALPLVGVAKDAIWPLCWKSGIDRLDPGHAAIRLAAILFGGLIGACV